MAIHSDYPGLNVQIIVNGQPLPEYVDNDEPSSPKGSTQYVEAKSGSEFMVNASFSPPFPAADVSFKIKLDGNTVKTSLRDKSTLLTANGHSFGGALSKSGDNWFEAKFCFAALDIVEEIHDNTSTNFRDLANVGTISVMLKYIENVQTKQNAKICAYGSRKKLGAVSEKLMKGDVRSHQACLTTPTSTQARQWYTWDNIEEEPFVRFDFKYRSLSALKSLGLIPWTPSPSPPSASLQQDASLVVAVPRIEASSSAPRASSTLPVSTPREQSSTHSTSLSQDGLSAEEIIAIIVGYRGHDKGLTGQNPQSLYLLLKYYEDKNAEETPIKSEEAVDQMKREHDHRVVRMRGEKRRKKEVIVLDD